MFNKLKKQIDELDTKRAQLDADWDTGGNNALLAFYVRIMPRVLGAERCNIFIYDPTARVIWLRAGTGVEEKGIYVGEEDDSLPGQVVKTGEHQTVHDVREADAIHKAIDERTGLVTRSILCIPIKSLEGDRVVGAVEVLNKTDGSPFTDNDRAQLEEMAHYLEVAIENIYFNLEATGLLMKLSRSLTVTASALLWIVGLGVLAIIGRVIWAGLEHAIS